MKQDSSAGSWLKFFITAGIGKEFAETYAVTFSKNKINLDMLPEIKKEYLVDMGITLMGHIIAILRHAKQVHEETITRTTFSSNGTKAAPKLVQKEKPVVKTTPAIISNDVALSTKPNATESSVSLEQQNNRSTKSTIVKMKPMDQPLPLKKRKEDDVIPPPKKIKISNPLSVKNAQMPVKNVRQVELNNKTDEAENKKRVFLRLSSELSPSSNNSSASSNGESVFARLGNKTASLVEPPLVRPSSFHASSQKTGVSKTNVPNGVKVTPTVKFNSDIFLQQKSQTSSRVLIKPIKGTMRADEAEPKKMILSSSPLSSRSSVTKPIASSNKKNIHSRLGWKQKDSILKSSSSTTVKRVTFGGITQKPIPRAQKPAYLKDLGLNGCSLNDALYNQGSIGLSTGVFSRLGE